MHCGCNSVIHLSKEILSLLLFISVINMSMIILNLFGQNNHVVKSDIMISIDTIVAVFRDVGIHSSGFCKDSLTQQAFLSNR